MSSGHKLFLTPHEAPSTSEQWSALYTDSVSGELRPGIEVYLGNELKIRINSLGCKGDELDSRRPIRALLGGSQIFGAASSPDCPTYYLSSLHWQFLNLGRPAATTGQLLNLLGRAREKVTIVELIVYGDWLAECPAPDREGVWRAAHDHLVQSGKTIFCTPVAVSGRTFAPYNQFTKAYCAEHSHPCLDLAADPELRNDGDGKSEVNARTLASRLAHHLGIEGGSRESADANPLIYPFW